MNHLQIETRRVGPGCPTFIVAEIGVNHDGSAQKAIDLVRIAATCGADAVKLQVFHAANLLHVSSEIAGYQRAKTQDNNPFDLLRRYELSTSDLRLIVREILAHRMIALATPFSPPDLDIIESLRLPAIKIASPDLVNRPLLQDAVKLGKPLLVSTGAADMTEVETTVTWLDQMNAEYALLHCISSYPTPSAQANLCWITELAHRFDVPIGYSDHTTEPICGALAAAAGATIIERHLTYDRAAKGPDHAASSDPSQFLRYVKLIREADVLRGSGEKHVLDIEEEVRRVSRQSLVLRRTLEAGDVIRQEDLTVQRPGTGLPAAQIMEAVGRRLNRQVTAGSLLQWEMLEAA